MAQILEHNLLPRQKSRKSNLFVKINLYDYASELYDELLANNMIQRLQDTPQLGVIKVNKNMKKSRYDYTLLQLYFHQLIKKNEQSNLRLTYNNYVKADEFEREGFKYPPNSKSPTIGDLLQLLTLAYSLGHFINTFTASRAVIMHADSNRDFRNKILSSSNNDRFKSIAVSILNERNYHRFHLLNSILVLEHCDQSKRSVLLAQELLYEYLKKNPNDFSNQINSSSKLNYVFKIFRSVRDVSYISYDLQVANMPVVMDLCNEKAICFLFRELLSIYNDRSSAKHLISSIAKMLDDTVYNENANAIRYYRISRNMTNALSRDENLINKDYYQDLWLNMDSTLNVKHSHRSDFSSDAILKLTFNSDDKSLSQELLTSLEKINNSRVGYYDRSSGEQTILVSIRKKSNSKTYTSFRILKTVVSFLRRIENQDCCDKRYLLVSKFFLHYLFGENAIEIKPTVDSDICVLCTRGKRGRIDKINSLLKKDIGSADNRHEVEFLRDCLAKDEINDTSITIPASIIVYQGHSSVQIGEFDGMVIHPNRKSEQILLLESKNTNSSPLRAKNCLTDRLDGLNIKHDKADIQTHGFDALLKLSIPNGMSTAR